MKTLFTILTAASIAVAGCADKAPLQQAEPPARAMAPKLGATTTNGAPNYSSETMLSNIGYDMEPQPLAYGDAGSQSDGGGFLPYAWAPSGAHAGRVVKAVICANGSNTTETLCADWLGFAGSPGTQYGCLLVACSGGYPNPYALTRIYASSDGATYYPLY